MPSYQVPKLLYEHEGETIEFRADLNVFSWLTEMLIEEPERFVPIYDELGNDIGGRMKLDRANIVGYFTVFGMACQPGKDWGIFADELAPQEAIRLWKDLDQLLLESGISGDTENDPKARIA